MTVRRAAAWRAAPTAVLAAGVFVFDWLYRFNDPGGSFAYLTDDHFFYLVRGWQILFGELPVRDFVDHGAPLYYYVGAAVQVLFGRGTLSEITFSVTVLAACATGVFLLATHASGSRILGLVATAFHILLDPRFYNYPKILAYVAAIPAIWAFADRPSGRRTFVVAVVTAIAFLLRHDHGVFVAAAFLVLLVLLRPLSWGQRLRHALVYGALVVALLSPYLLFIQLHGGVTSYFRNAAEWAARDRDRAEVVFPGLFDNPDGISEGARSGEGVTRTVATIRDNAVAWIFYGELALPFAALLLLWLSPHGFRPGWPHAPAKLASVAALGIVLNAGFLRAPLDARLADPSVPHAVLFAWLPVALVALLFRAGALRPSLRRPALIVPARLVAVAVVVPLLGILWVAVTNNWYRRLDTASMAVRPRNAIERAVYMWRVVGDSFPLPGSVPEDNDSVMALAYYVRECTVPTDRVFMQHYLPQVPALAERGFAGGHADLRPGFFRSEEMQRLTVERLQRQSVPIVLLGGGDGLGGFRDSFPIVTQYFRERYRTVGDREFDGRFEIRLMVRSDATPVRSYEPLGWPCFR